MDENNKLEKSKIKKDKVYNILTKLLFPIEFVVSILFTVLLYKFICVKTYENIILYKYLIGCGFTAIIVISIIIINYIKNKDKIEKIFLSFMIPIGMLYLVFMMPTYVPDEHAHMWKSYQISEGIFITPIDENGESHTEIPKFLATNIIRKVNKYADMNDVINQETDYSDKVEVESPAQSYPPILYIFSSFGLFLSRLIGLNGILAQYLARILNFIVFLVLSYYSIKILPFGKLVFSCFLFMPMVLQQAASISADSIVNSVCLFFIAYNIYLLFKKEKINKKEQVLYVLLSIFVGVAKIVYIPLVGLSLLLIGTKSLDKKNKKILITASIIIGCLVAVGWYLFSMQYKSNEAYLQAHNINAVEQIKGILTNPLHGMKVIVKTLIVQGPIYLYMLVGSNLGWLDININMIILIGFMILIVLSIFFEKNEYSLSKIQRIWVLLIAIASVILILMALYVSWTGVGEKIVEGIQGRYFIPIAILPLLCMSMKNNYVKIKNINLIMMLLLSLLNCCVISKIILFFI